jgi:quercetin dioxygenase-like cupin family protein
VAPTHVPAPTVVEAHGSPPKRIEEMIGRVNTATANVSVAVMTSPAGWEEPGQVPEFDEYTVVLEGELEARHRDGVVVVRAGEAVIAHAGEWVQYGTPRGARYVAVCVPAFSPETVHRDE